MGSLIGSSKINLSIALTLEPGMYTQCLALMDNKLARPQKGMGMILLCLEEVEVLQHVGYIDPLLKVLFSDDVIIIRLQNNSETFLASKYY